MSPPSVIVSGMIAATPFRGGATWAVLHYLLGFRDLGCDVLFVEPVDDLRSDRIRYCDAVMSRFGFDDCWSLVPPGRSATAGLSRSRLRAAAKTTDVLLNVSGMLADPDVLDHVPTRVYLDLDPGFVQLWHAVEGIDMRFDAHTHFVSLSDAIGDEDGPIPPCGREWLPTLPPVVLREWPVADRVTHDALTTVGHWRGYGSLEHRGLHYGQKAHSVRLLRGLPARSPMPLALALEIHPDEVDDLAALRADGWGLLDPRVVAASADAYRRFVQSSRAELGVAKRGYVVSGSGWFSDRSACYLASGRPVVAQDTGFDRRLPVGKGLFAFRDVDDVVEAVDELRRNEAMHRTAARAIAEEHLEAGRVLRSLLDRVAS
jgi:hypothetical protein